MNVHDFMVRNDAGADTSLRAFDGKVLLVVNVASQCGLTPQYAGLQALHAEHAVRGFSVIAFPCNQFGGQEPGTASEILTFCETRYGVTFPIFGKLEVNGSSRSPLYAWLTEQPTGPDGPGDIAWNFAKFVIGRDGQVRARFAPTMKPDAPELLAALEEALRA